MKKMNVKQMKAITGGTDDDAGDEKLAAANATWDCYSARKCTGKILSHRDPHNCKNNGGKSIRNNLDNTCTDL